MKILKIFEKNNEPVIMFESDEGDVLEITYPKVMIRVRYEQLIAKEEGFWTKLDFCILNHCINEPNSFKLLTKQVWTKSLPV